MPDPSDRWSISDVLTWTGAFFAQKQLPASRLDAEVLLAHALGVDRIHLYVHKDQPLNLDERARYRDLVKRRAQGEPVAYLTGHREFWSLDIRVGPDVLIPRPETEILVEQALLELYALAKETVSPASPQEKGDSPAPHQGEAPSDTDPSPADGEPVTLLSSAQFSPLHGQAIASILADRPPLMAADVGTGSGCIALALATEVEALRCFATDRSAGALRQATHNIAAHNLGHRIIPIQGHLLDTFTDQSLDMVVSNPPYVPMCGPNQADPHVLSHEPKEALLAGQDGLSIYRCLLPETHRVLRPGGRCLLEVGAGQADAVNALGVAAGLLPMRIVSDLAGIQRVVIFQAPQHS